MSTSNADPPEVEYFAARLRRASEHYQQFGQVWADFLDRRPHRLAFETDPAGRTTVRVEQSEPVPLELSILLGEFLYELRAALDNCLYAVAVIDSGQRPPPNAELLEWPICLTPAVWNRNARRYNALSEDITQALQAIQPYMAETPDWNCLRILHDMARMDRHRALHPVTLYSCYGNAMIDTSLVADFEAHLGLVDDDGIVATFRSLTGESLDEIDSSRFDLNFEFQVEVVGVADSPHPMTGVPQRPWGGLDSRLRALHKAVVGYTVELVAIAEDVTRGRVSSP